MAGAAMENCKAALLLFLRSLPSDSFFNVVSFGSEHVTLFSSPRAYDNASLDRASKHVQQFKADLGTNFIVIDIWR
jgi:carotenoid cleavage dioxygenase-like enzyme